MNEFVTPLWMHVKAHVEEELQAAQARLQHPTASRDEDQVEKGQIRALKKLLDLPQTLAAQQFQNAPPAWPGGDAS